jgi:hypothetical protein
MSCSNSVLWSIPAASLVHDPVDNIRRERAQTRKLSRAENDKDK